jgi:hypothetical protein
MTTLEPTTAYVATVDFLNATWERTGRPEEFGLFADMCSYIPGVGTADPAMWFDWLAWAKDVQTGELVPENTGKRGKLTAEMVKPLTPEQAYQAMIRFTEEYWIRVSRPPDIGVVLDQLRNPEPDTWQRWLAAIDQARASPRPSPAAPPTGGSGPPSRSS